MNKVCSSEIYFATVECLTGAGAGPTSPWISLPIKGTADDGSSYGDGVVVTKSRSGRVNVGLTPAFKFDTGCYFYAINATIRGAKTVFARTEETCYTLTSPSFIMIYIAICIPLILIAIKVYQSKFPKKKPVPPPKHRHRKKKPSQSGSDSKSQGSKARTVPSRSVSQNKARTVPSRSVSQSRQSKK
ncbi:hypothetical protein COOONC_04363 [Cooperia oncophora]